MYTVSSEELENNFQEDTREVIDHAEVSEIHVTRRGIYGRNMIYPKCATAHLLAVLCGKKTFSVEHIKIIKQLGYKVMIASEEL